MSLVQHLDTKSREEQTETRNRAFANLVIDADINRNSKENISVVSFGTHKSLTQLNMHPLGIQTHSGSIDKVYPIVAYFPMKSKEGEGVEFKGLQNAYIDIHQQFDIFLSTEGNQPESEKGRENIAMTDGNDHNHFSIWPNNVMGFMDTSYRLVFAQSYLILSGSGNYHLLMLWHDSRIGDGYLDSVFAFSNSTVAAPQWATYQFNKLHDYLSGNGIHIQ